MANSRRRAAIVILAFLAAFSFELPGPAVALQSRPILTIQHGNPAFGGVLDLVNFQVANPASNSFSVVYFTVRPPSGWGLVSCVPGSTYLNTCTMNSTSFFYNGTSLLPGAAVILGIRVMPPTGTYPSNGTFTTNVADSSNFALFYSGPTFVVQIVDPTTTVAVSPSGVIGFAAGSGPLTVTAFLTPSQSGIPISLVVLGYGPSDVYSLFPTSANTSSSGSVSAAFSPSSNNGATATIMAIVGTSGLNGSSGRITTLSPGPSVLLTPNSGPTGALVSLSGVGFLAGPVSVDFDGIEVGFTNVTSTGAPFGVSFAAPSVPLGPYVVRAVGQGGVTAGAVFDLVAAFDFGLSLSSNATIVGPGQPFATNVSASVLAGISESISFSVNAQTGVAAPALTPSIGIPPFQASLHGVAPVAPGTFTYTITAFLGSLSHQIRFSIVVPPPSISLSSGSSPPGSSVTLTGQDFPPLTTVTVVLGQSEVGSVQTDAGGTFQLVLVVPSVGPGNYTLSAAGGGAPASALFVVLAAPSSSSTTTVIEPPVSWIDVTVVGGVALAGLAVTWWALNRPPKPGDIRFTVEVIPEEEVTAREEKA